MAVRHGKAGQYGKREAIKRQRRMFNVLFVVGSLSFSALGFVYGWLWARDFIIWILPATIILVGGIGVVTRFADRQLEKVAKERLRFLRGGQAEALVAWLLEELPSDWHVFNTIKLEKESDIDHVVVGPGGLYCISTKAHRGLFSGTAQGLLHNGQHCDFAKNVQRQTMNLRERLAVAMGRDVPAWVQPVLAVPFGYTEHDPFEGKVWLVNAEDVVARIAPDKVTKRLSGQQVKRIVKVLEMMQANAADAYERPVADVYVEATSSDAPLH